MSARPLVDDARAALRAGDIDAALASFAALAEQSPGDADAWLGLGICCAQQRRFDDAVAHLERAVAISPSPPAVLALANALSDAGSVDAAIAQGESLVLAHPGFAPGWNAFGSALERAQRLDEAARAFGEALRADARYWRAAAALARVESARGDLDAAARAYRRWIEADPRSFDATLGLARTLHRQACVLEAIALYSDALAIRDDADAHNDLGIAYTDIAEIGLAREHYRAALRLRPDYAEVESNLLVNLHYGDDVDPVEMLRAHRQWAQRHAVVPRMSIGRHGGAAGTRLRVGFVSGIFHAGPVGWMLEPVLEQLDRSSLAIHCYSNGRYADALTDRLRAHAVAWRDVHALDDSTLAATIAADAIDILVDLAGHGPGNRLRAIARKPAPVIASWLDYFDTTGVDAVDYILADDVSTPAGSRQLFTEEVVRFAPARLCYPPPDAPAIRAAPSSRRGYVTFGSFNRLSKLSPAVRASWAAILRAVDGSRLLLKNAAFTDAQVRERFTAHFASLGIAAQRLELRPASPRAQMFSEYGDVDIALDPFPYNGGLTTCDALWMGVPLVCVLGDSMISRQSASLLHAAGLSDLVAADVGRYVAQAVALAGDGAMRATLRQTLRARLAASTLCDVAQFARRLQETLLDLAQRAPGN